MGRHIYPDLKYTTEFSFLCIIIINSFKGKNYFFLTTHYYQMNKKKKKEESVPQNEPYYSPGENLQINK